MSLKVLVVDDDDVIVFLHNLFLEENGISGSIGFENGKDALDFLNAQTDKNEAYLILLDINMPVMNGWQLLDSIKDSPYENRVFVAVVTSSIDSEDHEKASQYPQVIGYFEKPLNDIAIKQLQQLPQLSNYISS